MNLALPREALHRFCALDISTMVATRAAIREVRREIRAPVTSIHSAGSLGRQGATARKECRLLLSLPRAAALARNSEASASDIVVVYVVFCAFIVGVIAIEARGLPVGRFVRVAPGI